MKKTGYSLLIGLLMFALVMTARAQTPVDTLQQLVVDFWPDYDQPNVLVLLTGTLPDDTPLPAEVVLPLPAEAVMHVAARITPDDVMIDDIVYTIEGNQLRITLPETRFRVEYYLPYTAENNTRSFTFNWLSSISVDEMLTAVQQPVAAAALTTQPTAANVTQSPTDGFVYHTFPAQAVPAGKPLTASFAYTMSNPPRLSVEGVPLVGNGAAAVSTPDPSAAATNSPVNWILLLSVAAIVTSAVALTWVIATQRAQTKVRKPQPIRRAAEKPDTAVTAKPAARFCHQCGEPLRVEDRFCRQCGTAVKSK
ncbi:MAG: zinc ribbon domain-containing protein [Chloroflexi bacterium]|nr:zinc ribbon domain-containing protein [Chloroflexota bacterium]